MKSESNSSWSTAHLPGNKLKRHRIIHLNTLFEFQRKGICAWIPRWNSVKKSNYLHSMLGFHWLHENSISITAIRHPSRWIFKFLGIINLSKFPWIHWVRHFFSQNHVNNMQPCIYRMLKAEYHDASIYCLKKDYIVIVLASLIPFMKYIHISFCFMTTTTTAMMIIRIICIIQLISVALMLQNNNNKIWQIQQYSSTRLMMVRLTMFSYGVLRLT